MYNRNTEPAAEPENSSHNIEPAPAADQRAPARRNPRLLLIGRVDFYDLLLEQDEQ